MTPNIKKLIDQETSLGTNYIEQSCGYYTEDAKHYDISEEEFLVLRMMISNGYNLIQHHLFAGTTPTPIEVELCGYLDSALKKLPIEDSTPWLYRWDDVSVIQSTQVGQVINYPGYLTVSRQPYLGITARYQLIVHLAARTQARSIYKVCESTPCAPEDQVEFPNGTQFLVMDYRHDGAFTVIELVEQPKHLLPVERLSQNVSDFFKQIKSIDINGAIKKGLNSRIRQTVSVDGQKINCRCDSEGNVQMSPTYAQAMWNLSYVSVVLSDMQICNEMLCKQYNTTLESVCNEIDKARCDDYRARYFKALNDAIPVDEMLMLVYDYLQNKALSSFDKLLSSLPVDGELESRVNGVYCAGMGCVLLHELTHFDNDHFERLKKEKRRDLELEADNNAFDGILSLEEKKERHTAIMGAICSQLLGFFMNPKMVPYDNYYSSDVRLFTQYDKIVEERRSASIIIAHVLQYWLKAFHQIDIEVELDKEEAAVENMRTAIIKLRETKSGA